jgi:hypothetical protein
MKQLTFQSFKFVFESKSSVTRTCSSTNQMSFTHMKTADTSLSFRNQIFKFSK